MKKRVAACSTALGLSALALTGCGPRVFANCTEMNQVYPGGVGRVGAVDHRVNGGHANYPPYWDTVLYTANSGSDRDRDGIACEQ